MSGLQMLKFIVRAAIAPSRVLKQRSSVENVWYDSNRDDEHAGQSSIATRLSNFTALVIIAIVVTSPLWNLPLPASLANGPLGTIKYSVQIFMCHVGLLLWPCAGFLIKRLMKQKRWVERLKLLALIAFCVWVGWSSAYEVGLFWMDLLR